MNYQKLYNSIIDNRLSNEFDGYTESHHIIPRSLGGSDDKSNLVSLSAREHFICHYLLAKMYPEGSFEWYKMNHAFMMMKCESFNQERYFNSRLYESLKCHHSSLMSIAQSGKNNSQYGKMWICNVELKENKKISKGDDIPDGWVKGRNVWNRAESEKEKAERERKKVESEKEKAERERKKAEREKEKIEDAKYFIDLFEIFKKGDFISVSEFYKKIKPEFSLMTLVKKWSKLCPDYKPVERIPFSSKDIR